MGKQSYGWFYTDTQYMIAIPFHLHFMTRITMIMLKFSQLV